MTKSSSRWLFVLLAVIGFVLLAGPAGAQTTTTVDDDDYTPPAQVLPVTVEKAPVARTGTDSMIYVRAGVAAIALGIGLVALSKHRGKAEVFMATAGTGASAGPARGGRKGDGR